MKTISQPVNKSLGNHLWPLGPSFSTVFFDIETTGFHRQNSQVMLIGLMVLSQTSSHLIQFFSEGPEDEKLLLTAFIEALSQPTLLISFNGHSFDIPYLCARMVYHHLYSSTQDALANMMQNSLHIDLYQVAKRSGLSLPNYRLKTIEAYLNIAREDKISGLESVQLYKNYLLKPNTELLETILGHNADDIRNLSRLDGIYDLLKLPTKVYLKPNLTPKRNLLVCNLDQALLIEGFTKSPLHCFYEFDTHMLSRKGFRFSMRLKYVTIETGGQTLQVIHYKSLPGPLQHRDPEGWVIQIDDHVVEDVLYQVVDSLLDFSET